MIKEGNTYKDFPANGILKIPKDFYTLLALHTGRRVDIFYEEKMIFIRKENPKSSHNKRLISEKGYLKIPKEIIEIVNVTPEDYYCMYIDEPNKQLVVEVQ